MIELRALTRRYEDAIAVDALDLKIERGELMVLVGASGCGKTTTLKMINRLIEPSSGSVWVDGANVLDVDAPTLRRRIGYGFQRVGLFPHMSVGENVGITPSLLGWEDARTRRRVDELLDLVQLEPARYRDRDPATLSGGQQQRVALARALAAEPNVVLLDEPFGALDPLTRDDLQAELLRIRSALGLTVVFVTHDMGEALLLADRIAVMDAGRLLRCATPAELLQDPGSPIVEHLIATPQRQIERIAALRTGAATAPARS